MNEFHIYLRNLSYTIVLLLSITAIFNIFADPFELFSSPKLEGVNSLKPEYHKHIRMIKAHQVRVIKPTVILLGSSRVEVGLNPEHPLLNQTEDVIYNLALSSANIYEIFRYLQHAHTIHPLRQVIIGLDFFMFNINKHNEPDFKESRLAPNNMGWYKDLFESVLSFDALKKSYLTITQQNQSPGTIYLANGFRDDKHTWQEIKQVGGHRKAAINNESYTLHAIDGYVFFSLYSQDRQSAKIETFKQLLSFCKDNQIDLRLFISPAHARKQVLLDILGLWPQYEQWKRELTESMKLYPNAILWDFSGFNSITTEPFPASDDKITQMTGYWESSHYKKEIGNIILRKILSSKTNEKNPPQDFGVTLNSETIEAWIKKSNSDLTGYLLNHPELNLEFRSLLEATRTKRNQLLEANKQLRSIDSFQESRIH